jgi:hypothetical protein
MKASLDAALIDKRGQNAVILRRLTSERTFHLINPLYRCFFQTFSLADMPA